MYFCTDDLKDYTFANGMGLDYTYRMLKIRNSDPVIVFDKNGSVRALTGYAFSPNDYGISMATIGVLGTTCIMPLENDKDSVIMVTSQGYGKIMDMSEVTRAKGRAMTLNEGDTLTTVIPINHDYNPDSLVCLTSGDKMFYLRVVDFPRYKRASAGNRMVKSAKYDINITGGTFIDGDSQYLMIYGESGYGKIMDVQYLGFAKRGNNVVGLNGKRVDGAIGVASSDKNLTKIEVYAMNKDRVAHRDGEIQVDKAVMLSMDNGTSTKFKVGTSMAQPTKLLRLNKNDWYTMVEK